jgi:hypothetical protein
MPQTEDTWPQFLFKLGANSKVKMKEAKTGTKQTCNQSSFFTYIIGPHWSFIHPQFWICPLPAPAWTDAYSDP